MISKPIEIVEEQSYIYLMELPDGSLSLEGVRKDPLGSDVPNHPVFLMQRIRFSRAAIKAMLPFLQEWSKDD